MDTDKPVENVAPPIGMAAGACAICFMIALLALKFISISAGNLWPACILSVCIPIVIAFYILHRSAWHRELSGGIRFMSTLLSACIIYAVIVAMSVFTVIVAAMFFGNGMLSS
jgi:cation transport ATPase